MSGGPAASSGLIITPRSLAAPESLSGSILAGAEGLGLPLAPSLCAAPPPQTRVSRLESAAFGVSGPGAQARLERVLGGEGFFVSTGHQPVLFLGPLYVVYKALTAIGLAARLEEIWEVPVVPLFWVASDDHDWAEVGQTSLIDVEGGLRTLRLEAPEGYEGRPVGPAPLGEPGVGLVDEMAQLLPTSEFTDVVLKQIRDSYAAQATVSAGFTALLRDTFGDRGYVWLDSSSEAVKASAAGLFRRMLNEPERILAAGAAGARRISSAGFEPPIAEMAGALPFFFDGGSGRQRVYAAESGARAGKTGPVESMESWETRLRETPGAFSPNVASRPALESHLLPVAATVLGPGEIAYWGQLPPLFEALDVAFPAIHPRAAWTLIEPRIQRLLGRFDLGPEELADGGESTMARLTASSRPEAVDQRLNGLRDTLVDGLEDLDSAIGETLPGLKATVGKTRKALSDALAQLGKQIDQETRRRLETQLGQIRRCGETLFPGGKPQERVSSPFYYLARYGPGVIDDLAAATSAWVAASLSSSDASVARPKGRG